MSKNLSGADYPLSKIFSSDFEYVIPPYQRPYAWTIDQASELFEDLHSFYQYEPDEEYFLGSIVLIKEENKPHAEVIDGQQRLTTLTILLAVLSNKLQGDDRKALLQYILEPGNKFEGLESKPRLTVRSRDRDFFAAYVQGLKFDELFAMDEKALENESRLNIKRNSQLLDKYVSEKLGDDVEQIEIFTAFLLRKCYLVAVSTPNQKSAFRIFSVMNSRGLDLQPTDIIKADTIGMVELDAQREKYNERWEDMEVELGRNRFNDLFSYIRMIHAKEKAKRSLLEEFREHVLSKGIGPEDLISAVLEPYAEALLIAKNSDYIAVAHAEEVNRYLKWLNRIDNSDWVPTAIEFIKNNKAKPEYMAWFFERLERLAAFMHICAYNINQRIERYNKVLSALENDHSLTNPISELELTDDEKRKMIKVLDSDIYDLTSRRRNYLILRLDAFISDGGATYDPTILTIEHVLPQTVDKESEWAQWWPVAEERKIWVHRLANLVPLNKRRNSSARNFDFDKKKNAYFLGRKGVSSYALTTQVIGYDQWKPEDLPKRQMELIDILAENWRLKPDA
ncbi:DUF262 domain-containing protein [Psychrobacter sp. Rd 27.2]|uniref:DUF262 domain-containing protein n=1 Tax=Psychrobacter sp. Rd 27.2 TaxID=1926479 RepID=UPI0009468D61|nr:DUF262 domain-containing protein [Psychrobacter sp. Rd 27.2]OLF40756.1 hypothetical protein BTV99_06940 [Psychrobacter sp. Rd 27.2]